MEHLFANKALIERIKIQGNDRQSKKSAKRIDVTTYTSQNLVEKQIRFGAQVVDGGVENQNARFADLTLPYQNKIC